MIDLNDFCGWLMSTFDFDCKQNDFTEKALLNVVEQFEKSTIDNIPYPIYYGDDVYNRLLHHYLGRLKLLVKQIPEPSAQLHLTIHGIVLNDYSYRIDELQSLIRKLES